MIEDYRITKLRSLAIIVVVFGHSIILYDTNWGVYSSINVVTFLMKVKHIINTFQMPLFLFISGFCFFYSVEKHCYTKFKFILQGILAKVKRLLLPFVFIALFWMIPIRCICKYKAWHDLNIIQICARVFSGIDCGHLWFLPTLFVIFLISFGILPCIQNCNTDFVILVFGFALSLLSGKFPVMLFAKNIADSLYWFILGFEFCKYKNNIKLGGEV